MRSLRAPGNSLCRGAGQRVDADDHDQQHNGRGIGLAAVQALVEQAVHMHRQRAAGFHDTARDAAERTGRKDEGGRLADDAADGQNDAGEDAGHGGRQHDAEHRAQLARAEAEAALAVGVGHGDERLLGRAHDDRQYHDRQRKRARDHAVAPVQPGDEEQHTEQAVDDGRDAGKRFGGDADDADELVAALCVLIQVNCGKQAERDRNQQGEHGHFHGRDDGGQHGNVLRGVVQGKERRLQVRQTGHQNIADEEQQHGEGEGRRGVDQTLEHSGRCAAADAIRARFFTGNGSVSDSFSCHACFLLLSTEKVRLMMRIKTNSTTPVAISASRCSPVA